MLIDSNKKNQNWKDADPGAGAGAGGSPRTQSETKTKVDTRAGHKYEAKNEKIVRQVAEAVSRDVSAKSAAGGSTSSPRPDTKPPSKRETIPTAPPPIAPDTATSVQSAAKKEPAIKKGFLNNNSSKSKPNAAAAVNVVGGESVLKAGRTEQSERDKVTSGPSLSSPPPDSLLPSAVEKEHGANRLVSEWSSTESSTSSSTRAGDRDEDAEGRGPPSRATTRHGEGEGWKRGGGGRRGSMHIALC